MAQRALVTGCSTGIGRATALELHELGFAVIATARRVETITDLPVATIHLLDVDDDSSVAELMAAVENVDVLVNNAARGVVGPIETVPSRR